MTTTPTFAPHATHRERVGTPLEGLRAGSRLPIGTRRTITEFDNSLLSLLSMNTHPAHTDFDYAARTQFGKPLVVSPLLVSSLVACVANELRDWPIAGLEIRDLSFGVAVHPGDTLTAQAEVLERDADSLALAVTGRKASGEDFARLRLFLFATPRDDPSPAGEARAAASLPDYRYPRCYADFEPGTVIAHAQRRVVTETDNLLFARLTCHEHPDLFPYGGGRQDRPARVLPFVVLGIVGGMAVRATSQGAIANLGWEYVRFPRTARVGDELRAQTAIVDKRVSRKNPARGVVTIVSRGLTAADEVVVEAKRSFLVAVEAT